MPLHAPETSAAPLCWLGVTCTHLLVSPSAPSGFHIALWMSPGKIVSFHLDTLDLNGKNKVAFSPQQTLEAALRLCSRSGLASDSCSARGVPVQGPAEKLGKPSLCPQLQPDAFPPPIKELPSYPGAPSVLTEQQNRGGDQGRTQHTQALLPVPGDPSHLPTISLVHAHLPF